MRIFKYLSVLVFVLSLFFTFPAKAQCPMCKANVESSIKGDGKKTGLGLNDGIKVLIAMPYMAVGVLGFLWYRNSRQRRNEDTPHHK